MTQRETHTMKIAGLTRHLPLFQVAPGVKIAIFNMLGDTEVIRGVGQGAGQAPAQRRAGAADRRSEEHSAGACAVRGDASCLTWCCARATSLTWARRSAPRPCRSRPASRRLCIWTKRTLRLIRGKKVVIVDDVISTGSTLQGMRLIIEKAGGSDRRHDRRVHRRRARQVERHHRAGTFADLHADSK